MKITKFSLLIGFIVSLTGVAHTAPRPLQTSTPMPIETSAPIATSVPAPYPIETSAPIATNVPSPDPWPISTPTPAEQVRLNIQFQTESCNHQGNFMMCSSPNIQAQDRTIELNRIFSSCQNPTPDPIPGSDGKFRRCKSYQWQGHWIDMFYGGSGKRFIGIITVTKTLISKNSQAGSESNWYSMEVEILGKSKTVAKMSSGFSSWDQLQTVTLMAEEDEQENYSTRTQLRFGPSWNPSLLVNRNLNHEPIRWKVTRGKLLE